MSFRLKRALIAGLFCLVFLLLLGPFLFLSAPTPAGYVDGIAVCEPEYNPGPSGLSDDRFNSEYQDFRSRLRALLIESEDTDAKVIASIMDHPTNDEARISALFELTTEYPDNQLLHIHFLSNCANFADHPSCNEQLVNHALELNRSNAVAWSLAAIYRDAKGNEVGTDLAMQTGANAPIYDDYYGRQIEIMAEAVTAPGVPDQNMLRMSIVAESTMLLMNNGYQLSQVCGYANPSRMRLFEACAAIGERMYRESGPTIMNLVGLSIAQIGHRRAGNRAESERFLSIYEQNERERRAPDSAYSAFGTTGGLMSYDSSLTRYWFDAIIEVGESQAILDTVAEARRRSSDPSYAPCTRS